MPVAFTVCLQGTKPSSSTTFLFLRGNTLTVGLRWLCRFHTLSLTTLKTKDGRTVCSEFAYYIPCTFNCIILAYHTSGLFFKSSILSDCSLPYTYFGTVGTVRFFVYRTFYQSGKTTAINDIAYATYVDVFFVYISDIHLISSNYTKRYA